MRASCPATNPKESQKNHLIKLVNRVLANPECSIRTNTLHVLGLLGLTTQPFHGKYGLPSVNPVTHCSSSFNFAFHWNMHQKKPCFFPIAHHTSSSLHTFKCKIINLKTAEKYLTQSLCSLEPLFTTGGPMFY